MDVSVFRRSLVLALAGLVATGCSDDDLTAGLDESSGRPDEESEDSGIAEEEETDDADEASGSGGDGDDGNDSPGDGDDGDSGDDDDDTTGTGDGDGDTPLECIPWERVIGDEKLDEALGLAPRADGSVYLSGFIYGDIEEDAHMGGRDVFVTRYEADGERLWSRNLGTSGQDYGGSVAVESEDGGAYLAGFVSNTVPGQSSKGSFDVALYRLDEDGELVWSRQWGSPLADFVRDVKVHPDGGVIVAGYTDESFEGQTYLGRLDAFVIRVSADGELEWVQQFGSSRADIISEVAIDGSGNIYAAGYTLGDLPGNSSAGDWDIALTKLGPAGNQLWTRQWGSPGREVVYGLDTLSEGGAVLVGYTDEALYENAHAGGWDAFAVQYDATGNRDWAQQFGGLEDDQLYGVTEDPAGGVFVVGYTENGLGGNEAQGGHDAILSKLDADGTLLWTHQWGEEVHEQATEVAIGPAGELFIAGTAVTVADEDEGEGDLDEDAGAEEDMFIHRICDIESLGGDALFVPAFTGETPAQPFSMELAPQRPADLPEDAELIRIPTRVHIGTSELPQDRLLDILAEINRIWQSQTLICFEFEITSGDELREDGYDMAFLPGVGVPNGQHLGDHDIWVADYPTLHDVPLPSEFATARTAGHELGHGLDIWHTNSLGWGPDRRGNLMASGGLGFVIADGADGGSDQIEHARSDALSNALPDNGAAACGAPTFLDP